jgi:Protein RETICULATA-related
MSSAHKEKVVSADFSPWTVTQRLAAPIRNGAKLLVVGFGASMCGVLMTNAIAWARTQLTGATAQAKGQNPLTMASAYAVYMATSSNMRYQVVAGLVEERGIEVRQTLVQISVFNAQALAAAACTSAQPS